MAQRESGYARKNFDLYETPEWVTEVLIPHIRPKLTVWEPAAASGKIANILRKANHWVMTSDIRNGGDFFQMDPGLCNAIITNPPFDLASKFIWRALDLMKPMHGTVAMLLRIDFDSAKTRVNMFKQPPFAKKIVLTRRIRWFEDSTGSPSENHCWFIWDYRHVGPPIVQYGPD